MFKYLFSFADVDQFKKIMETKITLMNEMTEEVEREKKKVSMSLT